ncbi:UDP-glucuronosyltransferase 1-3, partial [Cephus cinctus]|uniref:UDP-glucuronosyltransferase 1-3 n=1 Tax=Cephus cinctus TaxID=211228 RepID=A0AAJ7BFV4_CEPCN
MVSLSRMMISSRVLFLGLLILIINNGLVESARILAIFPTASISHQIVLRQFTVALQKRGHELVVITPNPIGNKDFENYTEINTDYHYVEMEKFDFIKIRMESPNFVQFMRTSWWNSSSMMIRDIFEERDFKKMYAPESNEKFDLIIFELLTYEGLYGLASRFDAPFIGICSLGLLSNVHHMLGNHVLTSHESLWELLKDSGVNLPFWKRLHNFYKVWYNLYTYYNDYLPTQDEISKRYLGPDTPDVARIGENMSIAFVAQNHYTSFVRPHVPNVMTFGAFHVEKDLKPLPEDLRKFLDGATDGFVYVSLGSNVKSKLLPKRLKDMFLKVFSKLSQRVLWKFEDDLPEKPDNVFVSNWLPQESVLNHRNIKLFVYQGGLQSTEEAVHYAVPLLGLPVLGDQDYQVNKMVSIGVAKRLELLELNQEDFQSSIQEMINDKGYKERMVKLKALVRENPYDPMEYAIWWIEYVIRHKGAPHLRSSTIDEPWYQRTDMDVVAFLAIAIFIVVITVLRLLY